MLCISTHTNHREYIVITLDRFPGARCKQIIVHFSAQQEGDGELERTEQSENNNAKKTTENIKVLLNERGKEEKQGLEKRKTKENTMQSFRARSADGRGEGGRGSALSEKINMNRAPIVAVI